FQNPSASSYDQSLAVAGAVAAMLEGGNCSIFASLRGARLYFTPAASRNSTNVAPREISLVSLPPAIAPQSPGASPSAMSRVAMKAVSIPVGGVPVGLISELGARWIREPRSFR